ncbi:MAG: tocopherol cyclase family protein [Candidatus Lernaella stagnicola]|nr:tocopherol cyclase family protein [Candidatus Lernaella stagnicola]
MTRTLVLAGGMCLLFILVGLACDTDQEASFTNDEDVEINWPSTDPNRYHWNGLTSPFFEGWFFRISVPGGGSYAFIYAVQNPGATASEPSGSHVVVFRDGGEIVEETFGVEHFAADRGRFDVTVNDNTAGANRLTGSLRDGDQLVTWNIEYEATEAWNETMGGLTNVPTLPVNWHVGALRGRATGEISWGGQTERFAGAPIFQDHNWGNYFPEGYVWMQSQEFPRRREAVALAGGDMGLEAGMFVWRRGNELIEVRAQDLDSRFTFTAVPETGVVTVDIQRGDTRYVVTGFWEDDIPATLPTPRPEGFQPFTKMALAGRMRVQELERLGGTWQLVDEVWSRGAGVEMGGHYGGFGQAN